MSDKGNKYRYISYDSRNGFTRNKIYICKNDNLESYFSFIDDNHKKNGYAPNNYKYFVEVKQTFRIY